MICEGGAEFEEGAMGNLLDDHQDLDESGMPRKKSHGGCGARQPNIKREGLKFIATYKQSGEVCVQDVSIDC